MVTLEVVDLPNGKFGVQAIGADEPFADSGEFDTRNEAEEWMFLRLERMQLRDDMDVLKPGSGQGLR